MVVVAEVAEAGGLHLKGAGEEEEEEEHHLRGEAVDSEEEEEEQWAGHEHERVVAGVP